MYCWVRLYAACPLKWGVGVFWARVGRVEIRRTSNCKNKMRGFFAPLRMTAFLRGEEFVMRVFSALLRCGGSDGRGRPRRYRPCKERAWARRRDTCRRARV